MADNVTSICPILPQSPPHGIAPRVDVARSRFGRLFLQLLPLVSNKHLISLSLSLSLTRVRHADSNFSPTGLTAG